MSQVINIKNNGIIELNNQNSCINTNTEADFNNNINIDIQKIHNYIIKNGYSEIHMESGNGRIFTHLVKDSKIYHQNDILFPGEFSGIFQNWDNLFVYNDINDL